MKRRPFPRPIHRTTGRRRRGTMNNTEAAYADHLESLRIAGQILDYRFEPMSLRLADGARYTPDFLVTWPDRFQFIEIKGGFAREASRVRFRFAVETYPHWQWTWTVGRKKGKYWTWEETDHGP